MALARLEGPLDAFGRHGGGPNKFFSLVDRGATNGGGTCQAKLSVWLLKTMEYDHCTCMYYAHSTCTLIIVHACFMIIVHACTMIIVHAGTMIIVHACQMDI